jgi:hypothetical protein
MMSASALTHSGSLGGVAISAAKVVAQNISEADARIALRLAPVSNQHPQTCAVDERLDHRSGDGPGRHPPSPATPSTPFAR